MKIGKLTFWQSLDKIIHVEMTELMNWTVVAHGEELPPPKITSYSEAIDSIENVQQFLGSRGHVQESLSFGSWIDTVASLNLSRMNSQTSLRDFISH